MRKTISFLTLLLLLSSCSSIGYIAGGKNTTYEGTYKLKIFDNIEKSKSKLKEVLFADGWNKVSETSGEILFQNSSSKGSEMGIGKINTSTIKATFSEEEILLVITQNGNYKFGTQKQTNKTFHSIKKQYNN